MGFDDKTVYQVYLKSFCDSNADGRGDLRGLTSKLGYIVSLGVDYIWITPFFVSPQNDNGYDVADYREIDPAFGTMGAGSTPQLLSGNGPAEAHLIRVTVAASSLSTAANVARPMGATVNDLLLAAYARALCKRTGCTGVTLPCPVDLRRFGHPGQSFGICNLTSNYFCHLTIRDDEGFDEVLADVAGQMREQKEGVGCLQGPLLFHGNREHRHPAGKRVPL